MLKFISELKRLKNTQGFSRQQQADQMAAIRMPQWMDFLSKQSVWITVVLMWFGSLFVSFSYIQLVNTFAASLSFLPKTLLYSASLFIFGLSFICIGGCISRLGKAGIRAGKFPRVSGHPIYALRRIYGAAWTQVFYFKPLYAACLAVPWLKTMLFALYGYRGKFNFTLYPDAWIRDLPLLKISSGVYLANRCTVGTNLCLGDGTTLVDECRFDENAMVGHLAIFGLGCHIGKSSEIGVGASLGIRVKIGESAIVSPKAVVYHGVSMGNNVKIGGCAVIGMKAQINDGIHIQFGAYLPAGAMVLKQSDADEYYESEIKNLKNQAQDLTQILRENLDEFSQRRN